MTANHSSSLMTALERHFHTTEIIKNSVIQSLWSGYGEIARYRINNHNVVVKFVNPETAQQHPRGWNTSLSHQRKLSSYQNEQFFYQDFAGMCDQYCRVPKFLAAGQMGSMSWLVMEDLDQQGFTFRCDDAPMLLIEQGIRWLAYFHARFINVETQSLWPIGTYWHLATRPDELQKMSAQALKTKASDIDAKLNVSRFQTLVHGDAKLANFCFLEDKTDLAAVDFQYVGKGVGVKDVAYFLGSCLDESGLFEHADALLDAYFVELEKALEHYQAEINFAELESQWRGLYSFAWADFQRFLLGWASEHYKLNQYMQLQTQDALKSLSGEP